MTCVLLFHPLPVMAIEVALEVYTKNADGSSTLTTGGITFPGVENLTISNPWMPSPQYLKIMYRGPLDTVSGINNKKGGVRIYTDNVTDVAGGHKENIYPKPVNPGPDGLWEWERLQIGRYNYSSINGWETRDDSVSFGGLIRTDGISGTINDNSDPNIRAPIAWQVFDTLLPAMEIDDSRVGGAWNSTWAYVVDKSDKWNGALSFGHVYSDPQPPSAYNAKFEMITFGYSVYSATAWQGLTDMAQHPQKAATRVNGNGVITQTQVTAAGLTWADIRTGLTTNGWGVQVTTSSVRLNVVDLAAVESSMRTVFGSTDYNKLLPVLRNDLTDVYVYIAACFGRRDPVTGNFISLLPYGTYRSKLYVEIVNE